MKHVAFAILLLAACKPSEVTNKPAAEVSETTATTTATAPPANGVTAHVIKDKSQIEFVAAKVTRDHHGHFNNFDGTIMYVGSKPERIDFDIDTASLETDTPKLTNHLKTSDFFDVEKYPKATFTSTSLTGGPADYTLKGVFDLHGVKKEVTIPVKVEQTSEGVHTTSEFTINRQDWGIAYKGAPDDLIKDNVLIKLDLWFPPPPATT